MTNKEKEKLFFKTIKEIFKANGWKFNSYFVFKSLDDFFFDCSFSMNPKENKVWVDLGFKPMILDDVFWDITEMPDNKKMPLSFRSNAAFMIDSFRILDDHFVLEDAENPAKEILQTLQRIDGKVKETLNTVKNTRDYLNCITKDDCPSYHSIITTHIYHKEYEMAKQQIAYCRDQDICSGYGFGKYDFYDMAEKHIRRIAK